MKTKLPTLRHLRKTLPMLGLLLLSVLGTEKAWAQDYSGTYFIGSVGYNSANTTANYYLCPTEGWCFYQATDDFTGTDNGMPFLTTYQCRNNGYDARKAVWVIEKALAPNDNYYYIKQALTGRYLTSNGTIRTTNNADRLRVHLETVAPENLDDKELFTITTYSTYLTISPKNVVGGAADRNWLVVNGGNKNALTGQDGKQNGPTGYKNTAGIIGVYTQNDNNAPFYLEPAPGITPAPTITNNFDGTFTISGTGTIYYTTDDTEPTTSSPTYSSAITLTDGITVIKAIAKDGTNYESLVASYEISVCDAPIISFESVSSLVTITSTTEGSTVHYTTDESTPTALSEGYSSPFSISTTTTIKAITIKPGTISSSVTEMTFSQVATPTIQNNGSNAISITTTTDGATIYYTTDGNDPTTSSDEYTAPLSESFSGVTIKAIAVKEGMVTSTVGSGSVMLQCAAPVISFDDATSKVTIIAATEGSTIYYTTDGGAPSASSSTYSEPFSVNSTTTVKAITTKSNFESSTVTELTIYQVATPTIQNNGSNAISITTTTDGATIHYTIDGSTPTTSSTEYSGPLTDDVSNVTIKAIAIKAGMITSAVGSGTVVLQCATPVITRDGLAFTLSCSMPTDANLYYTLGGGPETLYSGPVAFTPGQLPMAVTAVARHDDYTQSETASMLLKNGNGTPEDPYMIYSTSDFTNFITNVNNNGTAASASYKLGSDISASGTNEITTAFTGTFDGDGHTISGLGHALFNTVNGGIVKNVNLDNVSISGGTNAGAIANQVTGTSTSLGSIYNCGILSGSVSGSGKVGSIVGQLGDANDDNCYARVINCFSYATVSGGSDVGGIVGYNDFASTAANIRTMVMNCMFYGDITSGTSISPVYGGEIINNLQGGLNNFNYYAYTQLTTASITLYNCALAVEDKYLNRFEFYRLLLNSNKKLAAFYATGSVDNADQKMLKWVMETADRTIATPKPYPVLKAQGYYPSIINPDFANAPDSATVGRNHGGKLGRTLSVTISSEQTTGGQTKPAGATITTSSLTLVRTDKDFDRFNYNYDKVQLPYYNDVGTGNYTDNRVVTGWKITAITAVTGDPYTAANYPTTGVTDYPNHNYADRRSSNKDLYTISGRVFSQGAYFDVPYGVTSITIEPYWGKACYIADENYDVVYKNDYSGKQLVTQTGTQVAVGTTTFNGQDVLKSIEPALTHIANDMGGLGLTVYDNALVLVGNLHLDVVPLNGDRPFTMMSVDTDNDHEPDYSLIYHHIGRSNITPIRFDFLNIPGTAQAQKPNGASNICNFTIVKTRGWFEITNTALVHSDQFEYENADLGTGVTKIDAPLILLGGEFDQFVSTQLSDVAGHTIYIHVGGNVWIKEFGMGTHSDGSKSTPHVPVSVTGGEFPGFYLTGTYKADANVRSDNAECYISGGYFHEAAGASLEQINGNVRWQIYNADIDNFFGGGTNDAKPITGDITTEIYNSHVTLFCGGPKFGNMQNDKTVTTSAEGCVFGDYFGAGFGGTSIAKKKYFDNTNPNWGTLQGYYYKNDGGDRGKYFDGNTTGSSQTSGKDYGKKGPGVAIDFDYEFFVWTSGATGARLYVKFASFSLAQCNDVESNLKNCIIDGNFYGGGSLGKVVGTAASELDGCTVKGNVYGAGYSASLPTLQVRDAGFSINPKYNSSSGMFEPGVFSNTTEFIWKNATEAGVSLSNGNPGSDLTNHYIYTDVDLDNLGSVQDASLILKGNTLVGTEGDAETGSVFGGGEESAVNNNTIVKLKGNTHVRGNVYGGGNKGSVGGNSKVVIED
jgi:hypothetical protein